MSAKQSCSNSIRVRETAVSPSLERGKTLKPRLRAVTYFGVQARSEESVYYWKR